MTTRSCLKICKFTLLYMGAVFTQAPTEFSTSDSFWAHFINGVIRLVSENYQALVNREWAFNLCDGDDLCIRY